MNKYLGMILNQADRLLETGADDKNDAIVLAAGRIRGFALLADAEPKAEVLPAVRPIKKTRKSPVDSDAKGKTLAAAWSIMCPSCGAGPGEHCVAMKTTSTARVGGKLTFIHGSRTGGNRALKNNPPTVMIEAVEMQNKVSSDAKVWGGMPTAVGE